MPTTAPPSTTPACAPPTACSTPPSASPSAPPPGSAPNCLFLSYWKQDAPSARLPLTGHASGIYLLLAGTTLPQCSHMLTAPSRSILRRHLRHPPSAQPRDMVAHRAGLPPRRLPLRQRSPTPPARRSRHRPDPHPRPRRLPRPWPHRPRRSSHHPPPPARPRQNPCLAPGPVRPLRHRHRPARRNPRPHLSNSISLRISHCFEEDWLQRLLKELHVFCLEDG